MTTAVDAYDVSDRDPEDVPQEKYRSYTGRTENFVKGLFEYDVMSQEEFQGLTAIDQLDYVDALRKEGLVSVRYTGMPSNSSPMGSFFNRMNNYFRTLEGDEVAQEDLENRSEEVESTKELGTVWTHKWFKDRPSEILGEMFVKAREVLMKDFEKYGDAAVEIINDLGYGERVLWSSGDSEDVIQQKVLARRLMELVDIYVQNRKSGNIEGSEEADKTYIGLIDYMSDIDNGIRILKYGPAYHSDQGGDLLSDAYDEGLRSQEQRSEDGESMIEILKDLKPIYRSMGPLYLKFSEMVLDRISVTGRPMVFLYRDGQFLKKVVNQVRKSRYTEVGKESITEGLLSRTVFQTVEDMGERVINSKASFFEFTKERVSIKGVGEIEQEIDEVIQRYNSLSGVRNGAMEQTRLKKRQAELYDQYYNLVLENAVPEGFQEEVDKITVAESEYNEQREILVDYLENIGAFEPFLDLADTGVGGSIMSTICDYREWYWNIHSGDADFLSRIKKEYRIDGPDVDQETLRAIYTGERALGSDEGYAVRTYMLITSRRAGDNSTGYLRNDQRGAVHSTITPELIEYMETNQLFNLTDYGEDSITMFLTHAYESRLNGYTEPLVSIDKDEEGGFVVNHGETLADNNENVTGIVKSRPARTVEGLRITGDPARIALNYACMREVRESVNSLLQNNIEESEEEFPQELDGIPRYVDRETALATYRVLKILTDQPASLINIIRFKTPTREDVDLYQEYKRTA